MNGERSLNGLKASVEVLVFNVLMDNLRNYFKSNNHFNINLI